MPKLTLLSNHGLRDIHEDIYHRMIAARAEEASRKHRQANRVPIEQRTQQLLELYPCPMRGEQTRIQKRKGGCSCSDSPVFRCTHEISNSNGGEASLWQYSRTQALVRCNNCPVRESLINVPS